ncbi:MAG TPA: SDR family NAD(P)-dependent oxidoreductase [Candidatus Binataceae bacterium]
MQELANKVAVVTGGGYGIGRQVGLVFGRAGAKVVLAARSTDRLESTRAEIAAAGAECVAITTDVAKVADCSRMAEQTLNRFGRIDILVNNAGIEGVTKLTTEMTPEEWQEVIDIDLTGTWLATRAVLASMKERNSGGIINISSGSGRRGYPYRAPYSASKWAMISLTQTWAGEWGRSGIRVNCICPGPVVGDRIERVISARAKAMGVPYEQVERGFVSTAAMQRMVTEEEIARVALFFASDQSSGVTGQTLNVDAGFIMN